MGPHHKEGCSTAEGETTSFWRRLPGTWVWRKNVSIKQDRPITLEGNFRKIHLVTGQEEFIPTPARTTKYCGHFRGVGASSPSPHTRRTEWEKNRKDTDEWSLLTSITVERTGRPVRRLVEIAHQMQSCGRIVHGCTGIRAWWLGNQLRTSFYHQKTKVSEVKGNPVSYIRRNQAGIGDVELLTKPHGNLQPKPTPRVEI